MGKERVVAMVMNLFEDFFCGGGGVFLLIFMVDFFMYIYIYIYIFVSMSTSKSSYVYI